MIPPRNGRGLHFTSLDNPNFYTLPSYELDSDIENIHSGPSANAISSELALLANRSKVLDREIAAILDNMTKRKHGEMKHLQSIMQVPTIGMGHERSKRRHRHHNKLVNFHEVVSVQLIPSRSDYSPDVKRALWMEKEEYIKNKARNKMEFAAERRDWRKVVEDHDMYTDRRTGQKIHPVHIKKQRERNALSSQRKSDAVALMNILARSPAAMMRTMTCTGAVAED